MRNLLLDTATFDVTNLWFSMRALRNTVVTSKIIQHKIRNERCYTSRMSFEHTWIHGNSGPAHQHLAHITWCHMPNHIIFLEYQMWNLNVTENYEYTHTHTHTPVPKVVNNGSLCFIVGDILGGKLNECKLSGILFLEIVLIFPVTPNDVHLNRKKSKTCISSHFSNV